VPQIPLKDYIQMKSEKKSCTQKCMFVKLMGMSPYGMETLINLDSLVHAFINKINVFRNEYAF